ncbi:MAG: biotin/lipoyl-binding protein [Bacilli bacterium]|nr:biotin/lipoyl-binding protein [Bacilli bacterium]
MKKYKIKVNGKTYEVELESVEESKTVASAPVAEVKKEAAAPAPAASGDEKQIVAPLQGTVVAVKVKVGDTVKKGQAVAVIEAMKLENDVASPFDGVVTSIVVSKGASVSNKDVLMTVK